MITKKARTPILVLALLITLPLAAQGQTTVTQTVTYEVQAINEISLNTPVTLVINAATAGALPDATDDTTTYSITTNETGKNITAMINSAMPDGLTLKVKLDAPTTEATSLGDVELGTSASDVVTGISKVAASGLTITYTLEATAEAPVGSGSTTVTFTLTDA